MNSHKSDHLIDDIIRQAVKPIAEAEAPPGVWQRIVIEIEHPEPHRRGLLSWFKALEAFSITPQTQRYCVGPYGRCLPYPFPGVIAVQFRGQHIAS
jgi:hypothetical protein